MPSPTELRLLAIKSSRERKERRVRKAQEKAEEETRRERAVAAEEARRTRESRKLSELGVRRQPNVVLVDRVKEVPSWTPPPPLKSPRSKKRSAVISVACSLEERKILRQYTEEKGYTFSGWARRVLFREIGIPLPSRHTEGETPQD